MNIQLKFDAIKVMEIEKIYKRPLLTILGEDATIETITQFLMKGFVNEDGRVGCSQSVALDVLTNNLPECENGLLDVQMLIVDTLCDAGFLPKMMKKTKQLLNDKISEAETMMEQM